MIFLCSVAMIKSFKPLIRINEDNFSCNENKVLISVMIQLPMAITQFLLKPYILQYLTRSLQQNKRNKLHIKNIKGKLFSSWQSSIITHMSKASFEILGLPYCSSWSRSQNLMLFSCTYFPFVYFSLPLSFLFIYLFLKISTLQWYSMLKVYLQNSI